MTFFNKGNICRLTHSQFGFDNLCYYNSNSKIPSYTQMEKKKNTYKIH